VTAYKRDETNFPNYPFNEKAIKKRKSVFFFSFFLI